MKLFLVRHGLTTARQSHLYHSADSELSEEGLKQAGVVATRFKSIPIDKIYSSPAQRAKQTAQKIAAVLDKEIEYLDFLSELKRPTIIEDQHVDHPPTEEIMDLVRRNFGNKDFKHSDEENFFALEERIVKFLDIVKSQNEENILAVSHEVAIKMIVSKLMLEKTLTADLFDQIYKFLRMSNTGITVLEKEDRGWKLLTWNDHAHLGELS